MILCFRFFENSGSSHRRLDLTRSLFSNQRYRDAQKLGGKESSRDGSFHARHGLVTALAA